MTIYELDGQKPELPADGRYWVAETATVIGRVRLGTDASVWFGSVLRGDNEWIELGERSQIQDNATLHTDPGFPIVIGRDCVIGHNVILHGAKVGDNSLIGMGAILLNGATIGKNSLVGAGALVTEGKAFPDGSLIVGADFSEWWRFIGQWALLICWVLLAATLVIIYRRLKAEATHPPTYRSPWG